MRKKKLLFTPNLDFNPVFKEIPKHKYHPSTPHNFIKLQRANTDPCQQVNLYKVIAISSSELNNCQQMDVYELVFIG